MTARGWLVFSPNYRGSDNLGDAYAKGMGADGVGRDAMAGLAAVERRASVDTTRIGVSGSSFGGYLTTWLVGHYHMWKTAVTFAAVTDLADAYGRCLEGCCRSLGFGRSASGRHGRSSTTRAQPA
jgi:dipeptidyl aminopeptidase/acylaminoacyl peptidase